MNENPIETVELELAILIRRVTSITKNKEFCSLDRSAYLLLHQIIVKGPAGVKALSDELHLDISTVSRQTASLEQKNYVYRIPDPLDKRAYFLQITGKGKEEFYKYKQARLDKISKILKNWSEEDRELFGRLLRKYNRSIFES